MIFQKYVIGTVCQKFYISQKLRSWILTSVKSSTFFQILSIESSDFELIDQSIYQILNLTWVKKPGSEFFCNRKFIILIFLTSQKLIFCQIFFIQKLIWNLLTSLKFRLIQVFIIQSSNSEFINESKTQTLSNFYLSKALILNLLISHKFTFWFGW